MRSHPRVDGHIHYRVLLTSKVADFEEAGVRDLVQARSLVSVAVYGIGDLLGCVPPEVVGQST